MAYLTDPTLPGQDVGTIVTLALENLKPTLVDNVSKPLPGYEWLVSNGRLKYEDGGYQIRVPIMTGSNGTISSYLPGDTFNLERPSGFTSAKYEWGFIGGGFILDGPTEFMTQGKYGIVNLAETYIEQLKTSFMQSMSTMLYGDGTGNGGADLNGLNMLVEEGGAMTGYDALWSTVGGIDSSAAANSFWRNGYDATLASTAWTISNGLNNSALLLINHYIKVHTRPKVGKVDLLLMPLALYENIEKCYQAAGQIQLPSTYSQKYYDLGWGGVRVSGVTAMFDQEMDNTATANLPTTLFGLNSKTFSFVVGRNKAFEVTGPIEHPLMDAKLWKAKMYAQLILTDRRDANFRIKISTSTA